MEQFRTTGRTGNIYQWCDTELVMVIDTLTGKPECIDCVNGAVVSLDKAKRYIELNTGRWERLVIVRFSAISGFKV